MDRFVYEPDDEIDESSPFEWRDEKITEFPYFNAYYPDYVRLRVMGKDMLKGEKYPKINYNDGVLYLDNAVIHASEKFIFYCTGMDTLTIDISGECYIIADNRAKIFNVKDIPVTIQGDGTLYTTKITADTINLNENVKLVQYDIEEYYDDEESTISPILIVVIVLVVMGIIAGVITFLVLRRKKRMAELLAEEDGEDDLYDENF